MMSVNMEDNSRQLLSKRTNRVGLAIRLMLEATHRTSIPNTPKKEGNLRADVVKSVRGTSGNIVWSKNYSAVQEAGVTHGSRIRNYTTPGTGPHYAKKAVESVVKDSRSYFRKVGL